MRDLPEPGGPQASAPTDVGSGSGSASGASGYTAEQIRAAERPLLDAGVPLMARAAAGLAAEVLAIVERHRPAADVPPAVVVLAGSGDNGGDALFASAHLAAARIDVAVVPTAERMHPAGLDAAVRAGARIAGDGEVPAVLAGADVVLDGIVGIGGRGPLRGRAREVVALADGVSPRPVVVAVDVPSGIDPDTGAVPDAAVLRADVTVTFGGVKAGLLLAPASEYAGRIHLVDIGIAERLSSPETPRTGTPHAGG